MNTATTRRYAKALFELAQQENRLGPIRERLSQMDRMIRAQSELRDLCRNPVYGLDEKKRVLSSLAERIGSPPLLLRFLEFLILKNRLRHLPGITEVFGGLVDEANGLEHVRLRAARPLSSEQESGIRQRLAAVLKRDVDLVVETDASLIGGMIIAAGSRIYDGSVKGQLQGLRRELVK